ncbi:putative ripening-related protein 1 [Amaranthus tricolor]|uniref:putative ripening-related protein 1 n=1 Tax=Amaranthus tricolor TaxID=29722 RepID=UPI00258EA229|nr:putative ripening-related protein 1 [Amaranthus tricolor]
MSKLITSYRYTLTALLLTISLIFSHTTTTNARKCNPYKPLIGRPAPPGKCDPSGATCCEAGRSYLTYKCSPPVTRQTSAILTVNSFAEGGDGGGPSKCDNRFHHDSARVVALSTGWFEHRSRCGKHIIINGNGRSTTAKVVDECDSTQGCDREHGYQVPCHYNVVDASNAVWSALGVSDSSSQYGGMKITWTDA